VRILLVVLLVVATNVVAYKAGLSVPYTREYCLSNGPDYSCLPFGDYAKYHASCLTPPHVSVWDAERLVQEVCDL
jgi:hypothetical protein